MPPRRGAAPEHMRQEHVPPEHVPPSAQQQDRYWLHLLLFVATLATTAHVGGMLVGRYLPNQDLGFWWFAPDGLRFAGTLLAFLTVHEFGHYFAARYHQINTSLPYYIPLPLVGIGTLGAVIRIRQPIPSTRKLFDVGAAGPLAGFVAALAFLLYALWALPPPEYLLELGGHEALKEYIAQYGAFPPEMPAPPPGEEGMMLVFGQTPLYWALTQLFAHVPPMYEMYHYPVLLAAWFGLFFTALNLLPVGQLDGGHVLYALFGRRWHRRLARAFVVLLLLSGAVGFMEGMAPMLAEQAPWLGRASWFILAGILYFFLSRVFDGRHAAIAPALLGLMGVVVVSQSVWPLLTEIGYSGWLIWCLLIVFLIKVEHPPVIVEERLTPTRRALGWLSILIFILCFSLQPIVVM